MVGKFFGGFKSEIDGVCLLGLVVAMIVLM